MEPEPQDNTLPLGQGHEPNRPGPPHFGIGAALLVIGALVGWGASSLGAGSTATTTTTSTAIEASAGSAIVPRDSRPPPTVAWTRATTVPTAPQGFEYAGTSNFIEFNGSIFTIVNFRNGVGDETTSQLWHSEDGKDWTAEEFDVGQSVTGLHITKSGNSLLVTAGSATGTVLLRSIPGRSIGGSSWSPASLPGAGVITPEFGATIVSDEGNFLVYSMGEMDIWRQAIEPLLPPGIDLDDPRYVFREDGTLFLTATVDGVDSAEVIPLLAESPEVVATEDFVWIRLVGIEGDEVLETFPLPDGVYPIGSDFSLTRIPLAQAWMSGDGNEFLEITGPDSLPEGLLLPQPWDGGFIAAAYGPEDSAIDYQGLLLTSVTGRAWRVDDQQPPQECSASWLSVSGDRIHLSGEEGTQCVRDPGSEWEILPDRLAANLTVGGDAGFVAYADSFQYDAGRFSRDGISWIEIEIPGLAPYPTLSVLDDRIVAFSVDRPRPNRPVEIEIWVGDLT